MWQVPQAWRPKSFIRASTFAWSLARAASRSSSALVSRFLAAASNSDHFSQISGLAFDLSVSEPFGNSDRDVLGVDRDRLGVDHDRLDLARP